MTITPYIVGRVNLKAKDKLSRNTPFLSLRAGYMIYLVKGDSDYNSLNLEPRLGFSHLRKSGKSSWSYFISANAFQGRVFPKIGIGFEF